MTSTQSSKAIFFSAFVFALTLVIATDAFAQLRTRTGGSTYPGSTIDAAIRFFDDKAEITVTEQGFFNITAETVPGQRVACTYIPTNGSPVNAECETSVTCNRFEIGQCSAQTRTRTSRMMCPTTTGAGCTGTVTVYFPDGTKTDPPLKFAVDHTIATNGACNSEFPNIGVLGRRVIGEVVQSCTPGQGGWNASDPVLSEVVRNDVVDGQTTFFSSTSWVDRLGDGSSFGGFCNANNGFPTGACANDGGTWFTVLDNPIVDAQKCAASAAALTCGQQVVDDIDPKTGEVIGVKVQAGPAPSQCRVNSQDQCECRCARCTPAGTLVNLGTPNLFVLADANGAAGSRPWAAACEVTVTGN